LPFPPFVHFDNILVVIAHWYHACGWLAAAAECLLDIETLVCSDNCHLEVVIECTDHVVIECTDHVVL
jgi:hypothetical protein